MNIVRVTLAIILLTTPVSADPQQQKLEPIRDGFIELEVPEEITEDTYKYFYDNIINREGINTIVVNINSRGGSYQAGIQIAKILFAANSVGKNVVCVNRGLAASAAMIIFQSCQVRMMNEDAHTLSHGIYFMVNGGVTFKDAIDMADKLSRLNHDAVNLMLGRTSFDPDLAYKLFMEGEKIIFDSKEAIRYGAADIIIPAENQEQPE